MSKLRSVFGGRVKDRCGLDFVNLDDMDLVGGHELKQHGQNAD